MVTANIGSTMLDLSSASQHLIALTSSACLLAGLLRYLLGFKARWSGHHRSVGWRPAPQPIRIPFLGNILSLNIKRPVKSLMELARDYPDCLRLDIMGRALVVVNSQRLVAEVCDERVYQKEPLGPFLEARNGTGDGLITAYADEENWGIAHRLLMPYLSSASVKGMVDDMYNITCNLVNMWSSTGESIPIDLSDGLKRLTLDTVALCAFDVHFNSFQDDEIHPFAPAMTWFMDESARRSLRPRVLHNTLFRQSTKKYWRLRDFCHATAKQAIQSRKRKHTFKDDILNAMFSSADPKTGKSLPPETIVYNTMTLLGAGFETTAGTLAFLIILLLQHPHCMALARAEVDSVLGAQPITSDNPSHLPYITACIRETLRLYPSAPGFQVKLRPDATSRGLGEEQYRISDADVVTVNLLALHRDPAVWGNDAEQFKPERMLPDALRKLPRHAWKPFGNGTRSCMGQAFAMQEAQIVIATVLQRLELRLADPGYEIEFAEALTLQPRGARVLVRRREG